MGVIKHAVSLFFCFYHSNVYYAIKYLLVYFVNVSMLFIMC